MTALLRFTCLLLILLWACVPAHARTEQPSGREMHFQRLGADAGLSQGSVMAIAAEPSGFLWLGTEDGLNRYDGGEMLHFLRDRSDPSSLPNNYIAALATDGAGRLWIGTDGGGVVWRGPDHEGFRRPTSASGQALLDPQSRIRLLHADPQGRIWIGTRNEGLSVIDLKTGTSREYRHDPADPASLSSDAVFAVEDNAAGTMWIGTQRGLDSLDPVSGRITGYGKRLRELTGITDKGVLVTALHVDRRGTVWIGTPAGLARFDATSDRFALLRHRDGDPSTLPDKRVTAIFEDDAQRLWVGTVGGLALLDPRTETFTSFRHEPADPSSLPDSHIVTIFQDRTGLLWFGTKSGGAASWNPRSWSFGHRRVGDPAADNIAAFAEDSTGTLWIGSYGGGLTSIEHHGDRVRHRTHDAADPRSIGDNYVMALLVDRRDQVWYGTMTAGLERLDPATGKIKRFVHDRADPRSLAANGVMSLFQDSRDRVWVGTYGGGACVVDSRTDAVSCYPVQRGDAAGLSSDRATAIAEDRVGLIWVGTDGGGLNVIDPASGRIASFRHDPADPQSLSADTVYAVHLDERGQLWVGTRGGGLDRVTGQPFAAAPLRFRNYSESDGLPNSTIYGIESDSTGFLWLSTNRGLARFDPRTERFHSVRESHGLQGDEFNFGAHYRSPAGELFFGGANGFNAFFPERLRFNELPPPVVLTAFHKFNTPVAQGAASERLKHVDLDYRDDVITFRFAALDFAAPRENRYAYMLEGFDQDWVDAGNARQATYTNLTGGRYVFRVKASNSDGRWNEAGISLPISVAQPPWLRWWAYMLYALTIALALFAVWAAQQRKLAREAAYAKQLEHQVAERTEEIAQRNQDLQLANEKLTEASLTDPLTGLGNRRCLRTVVEELFSQAQAHSGATAVGPSFVMMIVDLDRLKPINDQHGHEAGDRVLVQVAETLRQVCRTTDRIFRWGGDEFVVLCSDAGLDNAAVLAERIRHAVAKQIFRAGDRTVARTSCSIGFAPYPFIAAAPDLVHWEQSLAFADAALYQAKTRRNQWIGWAGTARAAELPSVAAEIERDAARLETEGLLDVRRRPDPVDETVDKLRVLGGPGSR
jgi:diguanylate cyclase (GGDEF)-like protein